MIIAAYAGTGKTYFAKHTDNTIDLNSMPFARILTDYCSEDNEAIKAARWHIKNPLFPLNYIQEVLKAEREYKYVIIPSDITTINKLRKEYGRNVLVVMPKQELKEEYLQRYLKRNNSMNFIDIFIGAWNYAMRNARELVDSIVYLGAGEYLTDIMPVIEENQKYDIEPVSDDVIKKIDKELDNQSQKYSLYVEYGDTMLEYPIQELRKEEDSVDDKDTAERTIIYIIGLTTCFAHIIHFVSIRSELIPNMADGEDWCLKVIKDKAEMLQAVEELAERAIKDNRGEKHEKE